MTATPALGFAFSNWTDHGVSLTNKPTLKFSMASNLVFVAEFVDITAPTLSITNLPASGNVSNEQFIAKGKAGDNVAVQNVFYNLNDAGWSNAIPNNNWTNWSAVLDLMPGTNVLAVVAQDAANNLSKTNTARLMYVVNSLLAVSTNGNGSINPVLNGASLHIGQNYTLTAKPNVGYTFTNWTDRYGTILTNKPVLTFLMASNLMLTANFTTTNLLVVNAAATSADQKITSRAPADVKKPTLTIILPVANQLLTNQSVTLVGKAADNVAVSNVFYNLNNIGWTPASTTNNWTNWTASLSLTPSTNYFSAYAVDTSGNVSPTNTLKLVFSTAYTTLNGLLAVVTPDSGSAFNMSFSYSTFTESSADTNNINGVGGYTYTQLSPTNGLLYLKYSAPMQATNGGAPGLILTFSAPGVARYINTNNLDTNNLDTGGIQFTSTPVLVPPYILGRTILNINSQGGGESLYFYPNLSGYKLIDLAAHTNQFSWAYAYDTMSPVGALVELVNASNTTYYVMNFTGTNYGTTYKETYTPKGVYTGASQGVFGLTSQRKGGNAPTNLVSRIATVTTADGSFLLTFPRCG